jgi:alpha-L-rhamnosidase
MNSYLIIFTLLLTCNIAFAQINLPPVFGEEYKGKYEEDTRARVFLAPQRILWKSENNELVKNADLLLQKGNQQADLTGLSKPVGAVLTSTLEEKGGILLDFGKELHGGIHITAANSKDGRPVRLRVRFGESAQEAMADELYAEQNATNDHAIRDMLVEVPWLGKTEIGNTGFRFVRIDLADTNSMVQLKEVSAIFIYRDIPYLGSFKSNDERLNKIWETGAYTVHLNMQNYLWDGIKRDRLVWVGDLHPEVMTVNSVFGKQEVVPKSLNLSRDLTPASEWMNGISSYSMWWVLIHRDWYKYHGDLAYLRKQKDYMIALLNNLTGFIGKDNKETLNGHRFLDWPSSENPQAIHAGLHSMMIMTLNAGSELMNILGEPENSRKYKKAADKLKKHTPEHNSSKQAAALMALAGIMPPEKANKEVLSIGGAKNYSTFYGYYILEAKAKAGDYTGALNDIRDYWGGMLDLGATSFWEDFDLEAMKGSARVDELLPEGQKCVHGDFGAYCYIGYRHSLAHGWASGPTPWLTQHILGIQVLEPGSKKIKIAPNLGDLEWAEGTFPTPNGILSVRHERTADGKIKSSINAPDGVEIVQ